MSRQYQSYESSYESYDNDTNDSSNEYSTLYISSSPPSLEQQQTLTRSYSHSNYQPINPLKMMQQSNSSHSISSLRQRQVSSSEQSYNQSAVAASKAKEALTSYKNELKTARLRVRLFRSPIQTITIFLQICGEYLYSTLMYFLSHRTLCAGLLSTIALCLIMHTLPGSHQPVMNEMYTYLAFALWWIGLGVLSSVGLGTGLHTFVLYLGPYIAKTTLAVTECNTLDVSVVGPHAFVCPTHDLTLHTLAPVTFVGLLWKIAPAAFLWGAGTALGELPPYFVSRQAALSGQKLAELEEVEEIEEQEHLLEGSKTNKPAKSLSLVDHAKVMVYHALQKYGFWAIVVFASIPNPLFDLAGLACGHFLIPFWTFFGATCIGKAVIKVQLQSAVVIVAFSKDSLTHVIKAIESIAPSSMKGKMMPFFEKQRQQFHLATDADQTQVVDEEQSNLVGMVWNLFLAAMIGWFVVSIIDSTVQERLAIQDSSKIEKYAAERKIHVSNNGIESNVNP